MSADAVFKEAISFIATAAAIIRFAIVEWEGVLAIWRRMRATQKGRVVDDTKKVS
jgi:hypothetical protein